MTRQEHLYVSEDERERARLTSEYKYVVDLQSKMVDARKAEKREIARNLLGVGGSIDEIVEVTGLSHEEVDSL